MRQALQDTHQLQGRRPASPVGHHRTPGCASARSRPQDQHLQDAPARAAAPGPHVVRPDPEHAEDELLTLMNAFQDFAHEHEISRFAFGLEQ